MKGLTFLKTLFIIKSKIRNEIFKQRKLIPQTADQNG